MFQAARFVTEMEYQHLVFEEFARKIQPAVRPFHLYNADINAAIPAEFAHAVYRFGHSMLDDDVARRRGTPTTDAVTDNSVPLLTAFLNPPLFFDNSADDHTLHGSRSCRAAIVMGTVGPGRQRARRVRRRDVAQQPVGLAARPAGDQHARARDAGVPPLNVAAPADLRRRPTTASWPRTPAGPTSVSTSSTQNHWSTSSPRTARTPPSPVRITLAGKRRGTRNRRPASGPLPTATTSTPPHGRFDFMYSPAPGPTTPTA